MKKIIVLVIVLLISFRQNVFCQQQEMKVFPLTAVQLLDGPFLNAQQKDQEYILSLDADRLLVPFLRDAGIETRAESYGNWENTGLDGHIGGHYLSALSLMYASTGNVEVKKRLDYMIDKLAQCQKKNGNGYVGGIPGGQPMWNEIKEGKIDPDNFALNGKWVPLYNIHKLFAGLRDAYQIGGNQNAGKMFIQLCDWFVDLTANLSDDQIQLMLKSEHGGMNEVFADAAAITGNQKYLVMAKKLSHHVILDPLLDKKDVLTGLHANTQIPKVVGYKKIAAMAHDSTWAGAAEFFWNTVVKNRSVSIGGNSVREHFNPVDNFSSMIASNQGPETCNTYNMMRLTKELYLSDPSVGYIDYYERSLYNHILSSQHPVNGGLVYFTPMRPRHYRVYSSPQESFWCCVGSGIENHGKYGELIYSYSGNDLFVNLFIPSQLNWKEKNLTVTQNTSFPFSETSSLTLQLKKSDQFRLNVRYPSWVKSGELRIAVNGKDVAVKTTSSTYVSIDRKWKNGDVIAITLPMHTSVEFLPDGSSWGSFVHGPVVLAAATDSTDLTGLEADGSRMGHVAEGKFYPIDEAPVIVKNNNEYLAALKPVSGKALSFSAESLIYPDRYKHLTLVPFFSVHDTRYMIYWQIASPQELDRMKQELALKEREFKELEERTIDYVVMGEQQPEVDHNFKGEQTEAGSTNGKTWRSSKGWFSYDLQNHNREGAVLRIAYEGRGPNRKFDLLVNDKLLKTIELHSSEFDEIDFIDYEIPADLLKGPTGGRLNVKFSVLDYSQTGRIYSIRLMKR